MQKLLSVFHLFGISCFNCILFSINPFLHKVLGSIEGTGVNYQYLAFLFLFYVLVVFLKDFIMLKKKVNYLVITSFISAISLLSGYFYLILIC